MVLASTNTTGNLEGVAELADKVMEVATPTVSAVTAPLPQLTSEIEQSLKSAASRHQSNCSCLQLIQGTCSKPCSPADFLALRTYIMLVPPEVWRRCSEVQTILLPRHPVKRPGLPLVATSVAAHPPCRLLYITDCLNHFLYTQVPK